MPSKLFFSISNCQTLEGFTTKVVGKKHIHYIFWDLEKCSLGEATEKLAEVQKEFKLGNIYVTSDADRSYRAWCFSERPFLEYIHILIHTFPLVDFGFFIWTVRRTAGTLRTSSKVGRPLQKIVAVLRGYEKTTIPEKMVHVIYDTGIEKRGKMICLG